MTDKERLAKIILDNPSCIARIDNDWWEIQKCPPKGSDKWLDAQWDRWYTNEAQVANSSDFPSLSEIDGWGILEALAHIAGVTIEGV